MLASKTGKRAKRKTYKIKCTYTYLDNRAACTHKRDHDYPVT